RQSRVHNTLYDAVTGSVGGPALHLGGYGVAFGISPDGKTILTGRHDGEVRLWDAATLTPLGDPLRHPSCICNAQFSHDGKSLLIACEDGGFWLWDLATRKPLMPPLRPQGRMGGAFKHRIDGWFSPGGKTILTRAQDHTRRLQDLATGQPIGPILA